MAFLASTRMVTFIGCHFWTLWAENTYMNGKNSKLFGHYRRNVVENKGYHGLGDLQMGKTKKILAIDPGVTGAFVVTDGVAFVQSHEMPVVLYGRDKAVTFDGVHRLLQNIKIEHGLLHVYLERAVPMAMGSKSAFSYGRGFEALVIALSIHKFPVTQIEPNKWTKEMHEGISADLRPKVRSMIAVKRLFPQLVGMLPKRVKTGALHDGPVDALLMAGYGLRRFSTRIAQDAPGQAGGMPQVGVLGRTPARPPASANASMESNSTAPSPFDEDDDVGDFY